MKTIPFARSLFAGALLSALTVAFIAPAGASAQPSGKAAPTSKPVSLKDRIGSIKKSLADSAAELHEKEWTQTTTVFVNGQQKKVQVVRCYYDEDGTLVKAPISDSMSGQEGQSNASETIENMQRQRMAESIADAELVAQRYLPPNPALLDRCVAAGHSKTRVVEPGKRVVFDFHHYLADGDLLSVEIDPSDNRVIGMSVVTTMGENPEPITMNVTVGAFPDGVMYTEQSELLAPAKSVKVLIKNTDFVPANR
jgi:hypothetical protein